MRGIRYKAIQAREQGAKAFLTVAGPNSPNAGKIIPISLTIVVLIVVLSQVLLPILLQMLS